MTQEELRAQFTFLRQVASGPVVTHYARDPAGRFVMVHLLEGLSQPGRDALMGALKRLSAGHRARVLQQLDVDGAPVIVTEYLQGFTTFDAWLEGRAGQSHPGQAVEATPGAAGTHPAGQFTQLFGPPSLTEAPPPEKKSAPFDPDATIIVAPRKPVESKPVTPAPPTHPSPPTPPTLPTPPTPPAPPPRSKPVVRWRADAPAEPEPTPPPVVQWKAPAAQKPDAPPRPPVPPPAPPKPPGEFTSVFGPADADAAAPPAPAPPPAARTSPPAATPAPAPSEFTRTFRPSPEPPAPPRPGSPRSSDYVRALHDTAPARREPSLPPPPAAPGPPPAGASPPIAQPGEFTRLMAGLPSTPPAGGTPPPPSAAPGSFTQIIAPQSGTPRPAPAPPARPRAEPVEADEPAERDPRTTVLVIALAALGLTALLLVLFVVLT